jgi:hypothetical protein
VEHTPVEKKEQMHAQYIYKVCPDNFWKIPIKEKQLKLRHFVFLALVNMATSDLHAFQAVLSLPRSASAKFATVLVLVPPSQFL